MGLVALACGLAACAGRQPDHRPGRSKVLPLVVFRPPQPRGGCHGAAPLGTRASRVPVTVSAIQGQVAVFVDVCIANHGPYPFLVDTGASTSEVDSRLAARLGLPATGGPVSFFGAGCATRAEPRAIHSWSLAGLPLRSQVVMTLPIPEFGRRGEAMGVIGSDIWRGFGRLRVDFHHAELVVPVPERLPTSAPAVAGGAAAAALPSFLAARPPAAVLPMRVTVSPRGVGLVVWAGFGHGRAIPFLPDTGSSTTGVDEAVAAEAGLPRTGQEDTQSTQCSVIVIARAGSGPWSLGSPVPGGSLAHREPLRPQVLDELTVGSGVSGLLGSDAMSRFGSVVFDYAGGRLALGTG